MSQKLNKLNYIKLIQEDIDWLYQMPNTLERQHIIKVLELSPTREYDDAKELSYHRNNLPEKIHWVKLTRQDKLQFQCDNLELESVNYQGKLEDYDDKLSLVYRASDQRLYSFDSNRITCYNCQCRIPRP